METSLIRGRHPSLCGCSYRLQVYIPKYCLLVLPRRHSPGEHLTLLRKHSPDEHLTFLGDIGLVARIKVKATLRTGKNAFGWKVTNTKGLTAGVKKHGEEKEKGGWVGTKLRL